MNKLIKIKREAIDSPNEKSFSDLRRLNSMIKYGPVTDEELAHVGIKGMKWGVRNDDGDSSEGVKKSRLQRSFEQKYDKSGKVAKLINKVKADSPDSDIRKQRASMLKNKRMLSDDDLQKAVKRIELEKKLTQLVKEDLSPERLIVTNILSKFGSAALGAAAGTIGGAVIKSVLDRPRN